MMSWSMFSFALAAMLALQGCRTETGHVGHTKTALGIQDGRFTVNRTPTFLLGFSYYGGLGAPRDFIRKDLDDFQDKGFNWLRVWATWTSFEADVSAVNANGEARNPFLGNLKWLVAECDRRGMVVDITLTRGTGAGKSQVPGRLVDFAAHERAVEVLVETFILYRNWYLDLANEHDIRDERYVSADELAALRKRARELDPNRLVTASFGGHDLSEEDIRKSLLEIGLDFLAPHRPRDAASALQTEEKTRECLRVMKELGRVVPVHYQEPFRRGYETWQPSSKDFMDDLRGGRAGGAAGWCFHNGAQRGQPEHRPRRSFDLRFVRLFDQLDGEERKFLEAVDRE